MTLNPLFSLKGKVALVTGGNGGLGLAMALGLAEAGADMAVAARDADKTARAVAQVEAQGVKSLGLTVDVTREAEVDDMVARTVQALGGVDILVNNAGTVVRKEPQDLTADEWDLTLDVNLRAAFLVARAVYPHMKERGGRQDHQHRLHVFYLRRRRQRCALLRQQGRPGAAVQEPRRSLGQGQHPVQRHIARLVPHLLDLGHPQEPAGAVRPH